MNPDPLDSLFALARATPPDTSRAEYAFETRLLARLQAASRPDAMLAAVSWRMIPLFGIFVLALFFWQSELASDAQAAEQGAYGDNPEAADLWTSFDL